MFTAPTDLDDAHLVVFSFEFGPNLQRNGPYMGPFVGLLKHTSGKHNGGIETQQEPFYYHLG
jgi:hypothetical protein